MAIHSKPLSRSEQRIKNMMKRNPGALTAVRKKKKKKRSK
ncbi:MAG: hypothetical protein BMS9Abin31_0491 [Gammaproteobacteria bacterium]|nr:MAG: hypothetical protein BMS9Abin31_0491 [Gammaproteobacteria bacterium]